MPFLRLLFLVLLILNALALAAAFGWLGPSSPRGEPERLTNQINPQLIRLEPPLETDRQVARVEAAETAAQLRPSPPLQSPAPIPAPAPAPPPPFAPIPAPEPEPTPATPTATAPSSEERPATPMVCNAIAGLTEALATQIERLARDTGTPVQTTLIQTETGSGWWVRIPPAASRQGADQQAQQLRELGVSDLFVVREAGPDQHAISLGLFRTEVAARQHLSDLQRLRVSGAEITARTPARYRLEITASSDAMADILTRLPAAAAQASREPCQQ